MRDSLLTSVGQRILARHYRQHRLAIELKKANFKLGPWLRIGPFRDQGPLVSWMENSASSFDFVFDVQKDIATNGNRPLLKKHYTTDGNFPTTPDAIRQWVKEKDWIDGYLCNLPRGPAPSAGETQFVYRTISVDKPITIELDFIVRSPESCRRMNDPGMEVWRRQARFECFLDGRSILLHQGRDHRQPPTLKVELTPGEHHFFAKVTNNRHAYGFTFSVGGLSPTPRRPGAHEQPWRPFRGYRAGDTPYFRETNELDGGQLSWSAVKETVKKKHSFDWFAILCESGRRLYRQTNNKPTLEQQRLLWDSVIAAANAEDSRRNDPTQRFTTEIEFSRGVARHLQSALASNASDAELQKILNDFYVNQLAIWTANNPGNIHKFTDRLWKETGGNPTRIFFGHRLATSSIESDNAAIATTFFFVCHYMEGLTKLRDFRPVPSPMPGVEVAAYDEQGRVITAMERALADQPRSAAGRSHREKLEALGVRKKRLIQLIVEHNSLPIDEILAFNAAVEKMWREEIAKLPPLVFLQRSIHAHDSMMFTRAGSAPFTVRLLDPAKRTLKNLCASTTAGAHDMTLSWDAKRIYIGGGGNIHAFDTDGTGLCNITDNKAPVLAQLTKGQSPVEMPDGRLVFFDEAPGISPCKSTRPRQLLFITDADGTNRKVVSANLTIDTIPQIMNDGRVIFARWDYGVNKNVFNRHALWTQNPDGTGLDLFFGNTVIDPFSFHHPYAVPNRPEVVAVMGTHHASSTGIIGLVWQGEGREATDGLGFARITPDTASVGDKSPLTAYQDPCALNEELFLVSYGGENNRPVSIYLLDRCGNKKAIYEPAHTGTARKIIQQKQKALASATQVNDNARIPILAAPSKAPDKPLGAFCPQPFRARTKPLVIADRVTIPTWNSPSMHEQLLSDPNWEKPATMLLQDVYQGISPEIERGRVKYLAVMEQVVETDPRGGAIGVGTIFYVNRLLGLVPVEADGSAKFEVPSMRSLYFHVLDEKGRMLMTMGSDMHAMPGERRSCVGCHEQRKSIHETPLARGQMPKSYLKPTVRPRLDGTYYANWKTNGIIEYESTVQPVLNKYCISCHGAGKKIDGDLDLTGSRTTVYNMSYMELVDKGLVHFTPGTGSTHAQPSNDYDEQAPLARGTVLSKLDKYLGKDHCGKSMTWEERYTIYCWIDANVPFYGHYTQKSPLVLAEQSRKELAACYEKRCASCHNRRPRKDSSSCLNRHHINVHFQGNSPGQWGITDSGMRVRHFNLSSPEKSHALRAPLAKASGGSGLCLHNDGTAVFKDKADPDYKLLLKTITEGTIERIEPTVRELIKEHR